MVQLLKVVHIAHRWLVRSEQAEPTGSWPK